MAIVVAYRPDFEALKALLSALSGQVAHIFLVDNSPSGDSSVQAWHATSGCTNLSLLAMGDNRGIAAALNAGIHAARAAGASHVLLSDQDSVPAPDMVAKLIQSLDSLEREGHRVGAIGPTYTDRHTGITFPFQGKVPGKFFYGHVVPTPDRPIVPVLTLITSGTLIPTPVFTGTGMMRDDFFIDYVDTEWCHRATHAGYELFGVAHARMQHSLGDRSLRIWNFGWRNESAYSPLRMYYRTRNFLAMYRMPHVPLRWKVRSTKYWIGLIYAHACFGSERLATCRMVFRGIRDAMRGRMGAYGAPVVDGGASRGSEP